MGIEEKIRSLLDQMGDLEDELQALFNEREAQLRYEIKGRRIAFEQSVRAAHRKLRTGLFTWLVHSQLRNVISAPFVYSLIIPVVLLDFFVTSFQAVCFRLYRIPRVPRSRHIIIDRHRLDYLNVIEKLNCVYCGYANGVLSYTREVAARTEQYWCPIKHARKILERHSRYAEFMDYGDPSGYPVKLEEFRRDLAEPERPDQN